MITIPVEKCEEFIEFTLGKVEGLYKGYDNDHGVEYHIKDVMYKTLIMVLNDETIHCDLDIYIMLLGAAYHDIALHRGRDQHEILVEHAIEKLYLREHFLDYGQYIPEITSSRLSRYIIDDIKYICTHHRAKHTKRNKEAEIKISKEAQLVADADSLYCHISEGILRRCTNYKYDEIDVNEMSKDFDNHIKKKYQNGYLEFYTKQGNGLAWNDPEYGYEDVRSVVIDYVEAYGNIKFEYTIKPQRENPKRWMLIKQILFGKPIDKVLSYMFFDNRSYQYQHVMI